MSVPYDPRFAKEVISDFLETVPRGWLFFKNEFPKLNFSRVLFIFQHSPKRWQALKKSLKLAERLCSSEFYKDNSHLILHNVLEHTGYYTRKAEEFGAKQHLNDRIHQQLNAYDLTGEELDRTVKARIRGT